MKKYLPILLTVISCLITAICMAKVIDLENRIVSMEHDLSTELSLLRNSVNNITNQIENTMEEQNSLLTDTTYDFLNPDYEARTVTVEFTVTPKRYDPNKTTLTLITSQSNHPMIYQNGRYTAVFEIPLFDSTTVDSVQFAEADVITTQKLNTYLAPREQFIPTVSANLSGSNTLTRKNGGTTAIKNYRGNLIIDIQQTPIETGIQSVEIWEWMDGEILSKTELSLNKEDAWEATGMEQPTEDINAIYPAHYSHVLDLYKVEIPYGSSYEMIAVVTDRNGLMYRVIVDRVVLDAAGEPQESHAEWYFQDAYIYGADGECLYSPQYEEIGS